MTTFPKTLLGAATGLYDLFAGYFLSDVARSNLYTLGCAAKKDKRQQIPAEPCVPPPEVRVSRARLILEECLEKCHALGVSISFPGFSQYDIVGTKESRKRMLVDINPALIPNLIEILDACADIDYVARGTMLLCGVPDVPHLKAVCDANDTKFPNGEAIVDSDGKFQKPEGWQIPDHQAVLDRMKTDMPAGSLFTAQKIEMMKRTRKETT